MGHDRDEVDDTEIRIGDTERNEARALLDIHLAEGRLTFGEHEERCVLAGTARVKTDVLDLFADLPAPHPDLSGVARPRQPEDKEVAEVAVAADPPEPTNTPVSRETPASSALAELAVVLFFVGLPATIAVTIHWGAWWSILANVLLIIISFSASLGLEQPKPEQLGRGSNT